jgi:hypothetical protein
MIRHGTLHTMMVGHFAYHAQVRQLAKITRIKNGVSLKNAVIILIPCKADHHHDLLKPPATPANSFALKHLDFSKTAEISGNRQPHCKGIAEVL